MNDLDHDLSNGSRSNANTPIESHYATSYVLKIAMWVQSVTVYQIFTVKKLDDINLTLDWANVKCEYTNRKATGDFLYIGTSNVCSICHSLRDIHDQNLHDLDLDLYNGPRSNVKKQQKARKRLLMCWQ